ncbi:MAG: TonB-dependent receptor [Marinifilaceae bacterium]
MFKKLKSQFIRKGLLLLVLQFAVVIAFAQSTITGQITDQKGNPLVGATVVLKDTYRGTVANADGMYRFENLKHKNHILQVSFIGYKVQEKSVDLKEDVRIDFVLEEDAILTDEVIVAATRAGDKAPVAVTNLSNEDIRKHNTGQDIPYQLSLTPSLVESSESGNGVGYSALRIRGTDATRINVTVNGIPLNDSESQGVFWVNMPDFSSSVDNIQIQRGVGTSTNGAAAFGATVNFQTETINKEPYAEVQSVAGSFNTFRNSFKAGTGLIDGKFSFDARYSKLKSDGFVDYAFSDHESFFVSGAYYSEKSLLKMNVFSGDQRTGISWWGNPVPRSDEAFDPTYNPAGEYTDENGVKRYYKNQTDNYKQTHYQLMFSSELSENLNLNSALHYTKGKGFYEQYKEDELYDDYGLNNVVIGGEELTETDLIRQKWLKNDFYGVTSSLSYKKENWDLTLGGAWNKYDGDHFGNIIWARNMGPEEKDYQWYLNVGEKVDYNLFAKVNYQLTPELNVYGDIQYRHINYEMEGIDDDYYEVLREKKVALKLDQEHTFDFFNPKSGLFYTINDQQDAYFSFGIAHREPTRTNFKDAKGDPNATPKAETLYDFELGYNFHGSNATFGANLYYMYYKDQLVPTGKKSNTGADIMTNVDKSYRAGIELILGVQLAKGLKWDANVTYSRNKIKNFIEYADHYDANWDKKQIGIELGETDIAYSPEVIASSLLNWTPVNDLDISFISKYVGEQFFDNTSSDKRKIDDYLVNNMRINYRLYPKWMKEIGMYVQINNLFDEEYSNNAYGEIWYEQEVQKTWSSHFPQAGINFMTGVTLRF